MADQAIPTVVDTHCHATPVWYEPVEVLEFQMERNVVAHAVIVQIIWVFDNEYLFECLERSPGRFAIVGAIDPADDACVERLDEAIERGMQGIRFSLEYDPFSSNSRALLNRAEEAGLVVSWIDSHPDYASDQFRRVIEAHPSLRIMIEHIGGFSRLPQGEPAPPYSEFKRILELAQYPNVFMKLHGLGEITKRPKSPSYPTFDLDAIPPFIDMAVEAFGPNRLTVGTDYPPCSFREGYGNVLTYLREALRGYPPRDQEAILSGTALSLFRF